MPEGRASRLMPGVVLLLAAQGVRAASVDVELEGLNEEMRDAVRGTLQLNEYRKREFPRPSCAPRIARRTNRSSSRSSPSVSTTST